MLPPFHCPFTNGSIVWLLDLLPTNVSPVRYSILTLPKYIGGLGILDSRLQQHTMQIRWLFSSFTYSSSPSYLSCFLSHSLISNSQCSDPLLPLLFSSLPTTTRRSMHTLSTLFSSIDEVTLQPLNSDLSMAKCLSLPLSFVIQASEQSSFFPKKHLSKLLVSDAYLFDSSINRLWRRTWLELTNGRNSILQLFRSLDSGDALIGAFLARALLPGAAVLEFVDFYLGRVDLQPFYSCLNINTTPLQLTSTRSYCLAPQHYAIITAINDIDYPSLSTSKWDFFFFLESSHFASC